MPNTFTGFPPKVFLIGAQKAGTTSLAHFLDLHPDICVAQPKEPHFFTRYWDRGLDWYATCFPDRESRHVLVDASTSYTMAPLETSPPPPSGVQPLAGVPERIHSVSPDAKFIYLLRDPVERTRSAYWHRVRTGDEKRPFREAIAQNDLYFRTSNYASQIAVYLECFSKDRFLFLLSESLSRDPAATLETCFRFIGVAPVEIEQKQMQGRKNQSYQYSRLGRLLPRLAGSTRAFEKLAKRAKKVISPTLHPLMKSLLTTKIPPLSDADRRYLCDHFQPLKGELQDMTGLSLDDWQI